MVKKTILFDLGNTLAQYFERSEFPNILNQAITEVQSYLSKEELLNISPESMWRRVQEENYEAKDYSVRPLEKRLARIFQLASNIQNSEHLMVMCRCFMKPIFALGRCYEDTIPVLHEFRQRGFKTGIISNTTWGSPAVLWREEVNRLGLDKLVDAIVFCRDVGWRKPAKQIFQFSLKKMNVKAQDTIFVGDDPRWDLVGPRAIGIKAVLIDRKGIMENKEPETVKTLNELLSKPHILR